MFETLITIHLLSAGWQILMLRSATKYGVDQLLFSFVMTVTTCLILFPLVAVIARSDPAGTFGGAAGSNGKFLLGAIVTGTSIGYMLVTYARLRALDLELLRRCTLGLASDLESLRRCSAPRSLEKRREPNS